VDAQPAGGDTPDESSALAQDALAGAEADEQADVVGRQTANSRIELGNGAIAYDYAGRDNLPHGIAGDKRYVFVSEPLHGRVAVLNRFTGAEITVVPAPPGGFLLPFTLRTAGPGHLVVLDSGGFPSPFFPAIPRVYDYEYSTSADGTFSATLVRTVSFSGLPILFSEDVEVLDDGRYVVSDSGFGGLWVVNQDGSIAPGIIPQTLAPEDAISFLGACAFPPVVDIGGIPFSLAGNFAPGVGSLSSDKRHLYFGTTCLGGVYKVPIASLADARAPHLRAADITVVSAPPAGVPETLKGLVFNPHGNKHHLYATDPFHLRLIRIDVRTGARTVVADDPLLFNFSVAAAFLPPVLGISPMVVASDQEHRLAALNMALTEDLFNPPFLITKVYVR